MEDKMGDGGVGDPGGPLGNTDTSLQGDFEGINADIGLPGVVGPDVGPDSEGATGGGPVDIPNNPPERKPKGFPKVKTKKVEEKKDAVKRKARKRSLLGDEETTVYRRSILGN
jgi:hypothetical protein